MKMCVRLAALLSFVLSSPASAVVRAAVPRAGALNVPVLPVAPRFAPPSLSLAPLAGASALAPSLAPTVAAPAARLSAAAEVMAPSLEAIAAPSAGAAESRAAADSVMDALLGLPAAADAPQTPGVPAAPAYVPAPSIDLAGATRSFARGVSPRARMLFTDTLKRRQAGWREGLKRVGVKGGEPLSLTVTKSADRSVGTAAVVTETSFDVSWSQGPTRVGAFRVTVRLKDLRVTLTRLAAPAAPKSKQVKVRLLPGVSAADAAAFFEKRGLRVVSGWGVNWVVAATGKTTAAQAVEKLGKEKAVVLYSAPAHKPAAKAGRLVVRLRAGVDDAKVAALLRSAKLSVVEEGRDGFWTVASKTPADSLRRLRKSDAVLYASPAALKVDESRQFIIKLKEQTSEAAVAAILARANVMREYGGGSFKLQGDAAAYAADPAVASVTPVGKVTEESVRASAAGAASHKGRPWSQTEYSAASYYARVGLETAGATAAQLALFDRLVDEAPVRGGGFNPWSGD